METEPKCATVDWLLRQRHLLLRYKLNRTWSIIVEFVLMIAGDY